MNATASFPPLALPTWSPWGAVQHAREIAPGIVSLSTAGHGGMVLSPERRAAMPPALRAFAPFAGEGWYEEDCDVAVVMMAFPEAFEVSQVWEAVDMARGWWGKSHPEMAAYLRSPDAAAVVALTDEYGAKCIREGRFRRGGAWSIHRDPEALPGARWGCSWSPIRPGEHRLVSIHADYPVVGPHPTREEIAAVAMQVTQDED